MRVRFEAVFVAYNHNTYTPRNATEPVQITNVTLVQDGSAYTIQSYIPDAHVDLSRLAAGARVLADADVFPRGGDRRGLNVRLHSLEEITG